MARVDGGALPGLTRSGAAVRADERVVVVALVVMGAGGADHCSASGPRGTVWASGRGSVRRAARRRGRPPRMARRTANGRGAALGRALGGSDCRGGRARQHRERRLDRGGQEVRPVGGLHAADGAAGGQIGEQILDEARRCFARQQDRPRRRSGRQPLENRPRRIGRGPQVLLEHRRIEQDALDLHRPGAGRRRERAACRREGLRQKLEERPGQLPADRLAARRDGEAPGADREEHREGTLAALEAAVARRPRRLRGAPPRISTS